MPSPYRTQVTEISRTRLHDGFFKIDRLELQLEDIEGKATGPRLVRELFERGTAAAVLPWDPASDRVLLIRQFLVGAHAAGADNAPPQVVAGMIDVDEAGRAETPSAAVRRELTEEAGLEAVTLLRPAQPFLPSPGGSSEVIHTFLAVADFRSGWPQKADALAGRAPVVPLGRYGLAAENETILAEAWTVEAAIDALDSCVIQAGPAVVLLSWFARRHAGLRAEFVA